jgi:CRP-like cAMP-binding protein
MVNITLFNRNDKARTVPAGTIIFSQGETGKTMFAVVEGAVNITVNGKVVETAGPGTVFGEMCLVDPSLPRSASAITVEDSKIVEVDENHFLQLVSQNPFFSIQMMQVVVERLRRMNDQLKTL